MTKDENEARRRAFSIGAIFCTLLALISLIIALVTDHWHDVTVDREGLMKIAEFKPEVLRSLADNVLYFDRHRGLFYQCVAIVLPEVAQSYDEICVRDVAFDGTQLDRSSVAPPGDQTADLLTRNILLMTTVVLLSVTGVCLLIGVIVGILTAVKGQIKGQKTSYAVAMSLVFLATVFAGSSMAIFHGIDFLERTKLDFNSLTANGRAAEAGVELTSHTTTRVGYSYYFGWLCVLLSCAAAILFLHVRKLMPEADYDAHPGTVWSSSTSLHSGSGKEKKQKAAGDTKQLATAMYNNAYVMMTSTSSLDVSSRTPSSDDWNPDSELAPDDPLHYQ